MNYLITNLLQKMERVKTESFFRIQMNEPLIVEDIERSMLPSSYKKRELKVDPNLELEAQLVGLFFPDEEDEQNFSWNYLVATLNLIDKAKENPSLRKTVRGIALSRRSLRFRLLDLEKYDGEQPIEKIAEAYYDADRILNLFEINAPTLSEGELRFPYRELRRRYESFKKQNPDLVEKIENLF